MRRRIRRRFSQGVMVELVMTDNGSCYRSPSFRKACKRVGLKDFCTSPIRPRPMAKAERFIETSLRERAQARAYSTSRGRAADRQDGFAATTGIAPMEVSAQAAGPAGEPPDEAPQPGSRRQKTPLDVSIYQ
jgi:hypothetical protein